jgi:hypothetical protein
MHPQSTLRTCSIDGCERPVHGRGWCIDHYGRWRHHGDPLAGRSPRSITIEERLWLNVNKNGPIPEYRPDLGPCWLWKLSTDARDYGQMSVNGKMRKTHQLAYELVIGPVPPGLELDHLCRVRPCLNPLHLEAVPPLVNNLRGFGAAALNSRKTHCPKGHPYDEENTYWENGGKRHCRTCWSLRSAARSKRDHGG